jgi:hypothetical protein
MQSLGHPWPTTEEMLLSAYEIAPFRGEPIARIIHHYLSKQIWPIAYLFSSFAKDNFLDNPPKEGQWALDKTLYTWGVLDLHIAACLPLGKKEEAAATFLELYQRTLSSPELFPQGVIEKIANNKTFFSELTTT